MMMWMFLFAFAAAGYVEGSDDCSRHTSQVCDLWNVTKNMRMMSAIPDSGNCRILMDSLMCIIRIEEKCHFDEDFLAFAKNALSTVILEKCRGTVQSSSINTGTGLHTEDSSEDLEEDVDCSVPAHETCKQHNVDDMEDFPDQCRITLPEVECIVRVEEKCHFSDANLELAKNQLTRLKRICGRESEATIRQREKGNNIWKAMECIRNVLDDEKTGYCASAPCKFKLIKYAEALIKKRIISDVDIDTLMCIGGMNALACLSVNIEKRCGNFAFHEYTKILEKTPVVFKDTCGDLQFNDAFPTMLEVYKENEEAENLLRDVLKPRRWENILS